MGSKYVLWFKSSIVSTSSAGFEVVSRYLQRLSMSYFQELCYHSNSPFGQKKQYRQIPTIIKKEISFDRNSFINLILLSTLPLSMPKNNFIPTFQISCYSKIGVSSFQLHSKDFSWDSGSNWSKTLNQQGILTSLKINGYVSMFKSKC